MDLNLNGKSALVTGGSKGIGKGVAMALAGEGCDVCIVARDETALVDTVEEIRRTHDVTATYKAMDISAPGAVEKLAAEVPLPDILINNAGAVPGGDIGKIDEATWREAWDLKIFGYINLTRDVVARMTERGSGVICNITGLAGDRPGWNFVAGASGNAALNAMTRAVGGHTIDQGVRVLAVSPGPVMTERMVGLLKTRAETELGDINQWQSLMSSMPLGRAATVNEVADVVTFLVSERASYVSGTIVTVDGGTSYRG